MPAPLENPNQKPRLTQSELSHFIGTENYYRFLCGTLLTDGTKYLAEKADAFWLMDTIASYQMYKPIREMPIQFWHILIHENRSAMLELGEDLPEPIVLRQKFPYVTFNADFNEQKIYCQFPVIYLPSEH